MAKPVSIAMSDGNIAVLYDDGTVFLWEPTLSHWVQLQAIPPAMLSE
jgi:hypothetical protein